MKQVWMLILASLFIVACGGGDSPGGSTSGGTSGDLPPERPTGDITVTVVTPAAASGCSVSIYDTDFDSLGTPLDTASTGPDGEAVLTVNSLDNVLYVVASGCTVREVSSSTSYVQPTGEFFSAFLPYTPGNNTSVTVTPFSTFGSALILNSINNGGDATTAMNNFSTRLNNIVGVDIDGIMPVDPTSPGGATSYSNAVSYGFLMSGISCWTLDKSRAEALLDHQVYNTSSFTKVVFEDLYDDGFMQGTVTHRLGVYDITVDEVRHEIAKCSLEVVKSRVNDTGFNNSFYSSFATAYNDSLDPIFGGSGVIPLTNGSLAINSYTPTSNTRKNSTFTFSLDVSSYFGIATAELYRDSVKIQDLTFNNNTDQTITSASIDTTVDTGTHVYRVDFTDIVGQSVSTNAINITYDNVNPQIDSCSGWTSNLIGIMGHGCFNNVGAGDTCKAIVMVTDDAEKPLPTIRIDNIDMTYLGTGNVSNGGTVIRDLYSAEVPMYGSRCRAVSVDIQDQAGNIQTLNPLAGENLDDGGTWYVFKRSPTYADCAAVYVNPSWNPTPECAGLIP